MSAGELPTAQKALLEAVRNAPDDPLPLRLLVEVLLRRGDTERAARVLGRLEEIAPYDRSLSVLRTQLAEVMGGESGSEIAQLMEAAPEVSHADKLEDVRPSAADLIAAQQDRESSMRRFNPRAWTIGAGAILVVGVVALLWPKPESESATAPATETEPAPATEPATEPEPESATEPESTLAPAPAPAPALAPALEPEPVPKVTPPAPVITASSSARELYFAGRAKLEAGDRATASVLLRRATMKHDVPVAAHFYLGEALSARNSPAARDAYITYLTHVSTGSLADRARRAIGR